MCFRQCCVCRLMPVNKSCCSSVRSLPMPYKCPSPTPCRTTQLRDSAPMPLGQSASANLDAYPRQPCMSQGGHRSIHPSIHLSNDRSVDRSIDPPTHPSIMGVWSRNEADRYDRALRVQSSATEALVGKADVLHEQGRCDKHAYRYVYRHACGLGHVSLCRCLWVYFQLELTNQP